MGNKVKISNLRVLSNTLFKKKNWYSSVTLKISQNSKKKLVITNNQKTPQLTYHGYQNQTKLKQVHKRNCFKKK